MSLENPTKEWVAPDIDQMLDLLAVMEEPGFVPYEWWTQPKDDLPENAISMSFPNYHPVVQRMTELLYRTSAYIDPYAPLPEDPTQEGVPFSVMGASFPTEYFATATLDQVRRYLVLLTRGERFCDGHIAGEFDGGRVVAALRRVRELRAGM